MLGILCGYLKVFSTGEAVNLVESAKASAQPRLVPSLSHEDDVDKQRGTHHRLSIFTQLQKKREERASREEVNTLRL